MLQLAIAGWAPFQRHAESIQNGAAAGTITRSEKNSPLQPLQTPEKSRRRPHRRPVERKRRRACSEGLPSPLVYILSVH